MKSALLLFAVITLAFGQKPGESDLDLSRITINGGTFGVHLTPPPPCTSVPLRASSRDKAVFCVADQCWNSKGDKGDGTVRATFAVLPAGVDPLSDTEATLVYRFLLAEHPNLCEVINPAKP